MTEATVTSFLQASAVETLGEGRLRARVPDGWQQGRGAFGGLGIGIATRAMETVEIERPLRALTAELPGPLLPGEVEVRVASLRRGRGMTTLEASIVQDGETKVRASGVFGRARVEEPPVGASIEVGDWRAVPPIPAGGISPPFSRFFEYRVTGPVPFAGGSEPIVEGWTRPREQAPRWSGPEVAAMADAYWPALFSTMSAPRPMATVTYTLQLTAKAHALDPSAPLFFRSRVLAAEGGFVSELRQLFAPDGSLVAINPQTFVIIKERVLDTRRGAAVHRAPPACSISPSSTASACTVVRQCSASSPTRTCGAITARCASTWKASTICPIARSSTR